MFGKKMEKRRSEIYTNRSTCLEDSERGKKVNLAVFESKLLGVGGQSSKKLIIISCCHACGKPKVSLQSASHSPDPLLKDESTTITAIFRGRVAWTLKRFSATTVFKTDFSLLLKTPVQATIRLL